MANHRSVSHPLPEKNETFPGNPFYPLSSPLWICIPNILGQFDVTQLNIPSERTDPPWHWPNNELVCLYISFVLFLNISIDQPIP